MDERASENHVLVPPSALVSSNPLLWFRFFGPGAIIASVTIGSGELLFPSRGGAVFGYRLLWVFLLCGLMKWLLVYSSMRHMILSGGHPFARWTHLPGPRGWLPLFIMIVLVVCLPLWFSFLSGVLGRHSVWFFNMGNHYMWATLWCALALLLLWIGNYAFLEKAQIVVLGLMLFGVFVTVVHVRPDWIAVLTGLFIPRNLTYPDWVLTKMPHLAVRSEWVEVLVYAGAVGGQGHDYLGYVSFLREKRWGRSHLGVASTKQLDEIQQNPHHPARRWLRAALIDSLVSFAMVIVISCAFAILGAAILRPQQLIPEEEHLLSHQATFLTTLAPWLLPLYGIAVILAFFGILYGGPEVAYRVFYEYFQSIPRCRGRLSAGKLRAVVVSWCLMGGLVVLWMSARYPAVRLVDIVTPAGIYTGVLACGVYCLANPWTDRRFLPRSLRLPLPLAICNIAAGVAFLLFGVKALWDYNRFAAFGTLALLVIASVVIAATLRPLYRDQEPDAADPKFV